jgi:membrane protease YdiL (CAAX protease family)
MTDLVNKKPVISQGWLSVLLFCLVYYAITFFIPIAARLVMPIFNAGVADDSGVIGGRYSWAVGLLTALIPVFIVYCFRRFIDRKSMASLGFEIGGYFPDAASGFFLACVILGLGTIILFVSGHLRWIDINFNGNDLFISFGMVVIVAFCEELVFRGYILNNLLNTFDKWIALFISAALFAIARSINANANIFSVSGLLLAGVLLGINYVYTRNLWYAILFHISWSFLQGPLLGFKLSGQNLTSLLQIETKGDPMITGGDFGFEGSMINILLLLVSVSSLYFFYENKYKDQDQSMA